MKPDRRTLDVLRFFVVLVGLVGLSVVVPAKRARRRTRKEREGEAHRTGHYSRLWSDAKRATNVL